MSDQKDIRTLVENVHDFVRRGFSQPVGGSQTQAGQHPLWSKLTKLGTELWLDTGSIADATRLWSGEFSALTTNNTLLNREVQKGTYDSLIREAAELLAPYRLSKQKLKLEIAFILNAVHGLKLVQQFNALVSVELHTDLAGDVPATIEYAHRYHQVCPEKFIVKIPFTPAGLLAARKVSREGIRINQTLGFSARQNYISARLARPDYVNVFMGRLNSFVAENNLGDGLFVGEDATLASQQAIGTLRADSLCPTRQIGASFRDASQVANLAGIDVMTIPPKVAQDFLDSGILPSDLMDKAATNYMPKFADGVDVTAIGFHTLWDINSHIPACMDVLEKENLDAFTPDDLIDSFDQFGCEDMLVRWSTGQISTSKAEGKIPKLENWAEMLACGSIGLDSLMNLAGMSSFTADQKQMDGRIDSQLQSTHLKAG